MKIKRLKTLFLVFMLVIGLVMALGACGFADDGEETEENGDVTEQPDTNVPDDNSTPGSNKPGTDEPGEFDGDDVVIGGGDTEDGDKTPDEGTDQTPDEGDNSGTDGDNNQNNNVNNLITYETYIAMNQDEALAYYLSFSNPQDFFDWYNAALAKYKEENPGIDIGDGEIVLPGGN